MEQRHKEVQSGLSRFQAENETLKAKLNRISTESQEQILNLQKELSKYQTANERLTRYIRELEQSNDDLERAKRALVASLEDFESKLNHQIEKNVLLENELGEKEELEVVVQRLKDEARDLKCELTVQQQSQPKYASNNESCRLSKLESDSSSNSMNANHKNISILSKGRSMSCTATTSPEKSLNCSLLKQARSNHSTGNTNSSPSSLLSPATRISALNIVSDLLRKVGALESKLDSCRYPADLNQSFQRRA